jgi:hypothetical protein
MPPLSIAAFTQVVMEAPDLPEALRALNAQLEETVRGLQVAYFSFDARRQVVTSRYTLSSAGVRAEPFEVSLDHLPPRIRKELITGGGLVDFGEMSSDYLRFFGTPDPSDAFLLVQGIRAHGELCGLIAIREPRQRFGSRAVEKITAPVGVFALAVTVCAERDARREAEEALEQIVGRVHEEYGRSLAALNVELQEVKRQLTADGIDARVAELQRAAFDAGERARGAASRLQAVEQQVATAVAQLEKAHVDLSRQSEALRNQGNLLHRIQRLITESSATSDPRSVLEEVRAAVAREH